MPATLLGTTGNWGIANDQTGILIEGQNLDFSNQEKLVLDKVGEPIGGSYWGEKVEVKVTGLVAKTSPFSAKLATVMSLGNAIPAHLQTSTGGLTVIRGIGRTLANEDFEKIEISATHFPLFTSGL